MTHKDIFTKYMIEYDKANITSSFPSLTPYEIATILDKAYLAVINLKINGNNSRNASIESDIKIAEDLRLLITRSPLQERSYSQLNIADNEYVFKLPNKNTMLRFIGSTVRFEPVSTSIDDHSHSILNVTNVIPAIADKYKASSTNLPWMSNPVSYIEGDDLHLLIDSYKFVRSDRTLSVVVTYVKTPNKFVDDYRTGTTLFELSDSVAELVINTAIIMSLESVESTRLDSKIKTSTLES